MNLCLFDQSMKWPERRLSINWSHSMCEWTLDSSLQSEEGMMCNDLYPQTECSIIFVFTNSWYCFILFLATKQKKE